MLGNNPSWLTCKRSPHVTTPRSVVVAGLGLRRGGGGDGGVSAMCAGSWDYLNKMCRVLIISDPFYVMNNG